MDSDQDILQCTSKSSFSEQTLSFLTFPRKLIRFTEEIQQMKAFRGVFPKNIVSQLWGDGRLGVRCVLI